MILNILASLASGIAGGFAVEWWKNTTGNTIAVKKGRSAVRNLSLIREKAKNISERTRKGSGSEEINNLLELLEKDLGSSIKDWNDILPAVQEMETLYASLDEKERDNENIRSEVETLKEELQKEKSWKDNEKEKLQELIDVKEEEAEELRREINELKRRTSTATTTVTSSSFTLPSYPIPTGMSGYVHGFGKIADDRYPSSGVGTSCKECGVGLIL